MELTEGMLLVWQIRFQALITKRDGMISENAFRDAKGRDPAFGDLGFIKVAKELDELGAAIDEVARRSEDRPVKSAEPPDPEHVRFHGIEGNFNNHPQWLCFLEHTMQRGEQVGRVHWGNIADRYTFQADVITCDLAPEVLQEVTDFMRREQMKTAVPGSPGEFTHVIFIPDAVHAIKEHMEWECRRKGNDVVLGRIVWHKAVCPKGGVYSFEQKCKSERIFEMYTKEIQRFMADVPGE